MNIAMWKTMLDAHFWANHEMLNALEKLSPEQYSQEEPSSFRSVQATVAHTLNAERFLLGNYRGEPLPKLEKGLLATVAGVREAWAETEAEWRKEIAALDDAGLERDVTLRFSSGQQFPLKAWQILHQLLVHSPYHRGQVVTLLHQVGGQPFKTDVLVYHIARLPK